ncbi:uncharacterized protein C8R40DRAFT_1069316 [Lentinula edodes]|uniref:uncharacterized protein n=1 Tax=Lentinula edodes TaxID=5353 RepID=UPI001E8D167E|nr:uncharacterized protein C8R40DRAFT_1069316 [Lentinula edodes]KAH7875745.1 hypothetical protein C8R40DRAFT_1069316 [Lentinula edodes]
MRVVPPYFFFALISAAYAAPAPVAPASSFPNTEAEAYASNLPPDPRTLPELRAFSDVNDSMKTNLAYGNVPSGTPPQVRGTAITLELEGRQPGNDKPNIFAASNSLVKTVRIKFVEQYDHAGSGAPQRFTEGAPTCVDELLKRIIEIWKPNVPFTLTYINSFYEVLSDGFAVPPTEFEFYVSGIGDCFPKGAAVEGARSRRSCHAVVDSKKIIINREDVKKGTSMIFSQELPKKLWRPGNPIEE